MSNDVVINVKVKGDSGGIKDTESGIKSIGAAATEASGKVTQGFDRARDSLGRFTSQGKSGSGQTKESFDQLGSTSAKVSSLFDQFGSSFKKNLTGTAGSVSKFADQVSKLGLPLASMGAAGEAAGAAVSGLTGGLGGAAAAAGVALAVFAALAPTLLAVGGAAAAATTLLAGLGVAGATIGIGFGGIGAALTAHSKAVSGAGSAAKKSGEDQYQAAKRIHDAEVSLADAKDRETEAAKGVNQARADEIDRLRELDLALRGQKISQAEATQSLIEAKEKARLANIAGSDWEKAEANNAVARAQLEYDSVSEKLGDLTAEKKKADKDGIEGSDQVQTALKQQTDAHKAVIRAQENLADAHHKTAVAAGGAAGGINAFNEAMKKLSPNAQKLVYALIDIEKRFDAVKKRVQDRMLAGFDKDVTDLADKWLPHLDDILGGMADHLNKFGHNLMGALGDSTFIKNIEKASKATGGFVDNLSGAADAFVDAFGRLAAAGAPVLKVIGDHIEKIFKAFDKWIKSADNSGKLQSFMDNAAVTLDKIFTIGETVVKIIGQFISIIFDDSNAAGQSVLDGVQKTLDNLSTWLSDPKHQKDIKDITDKAKQFVQLFMTYVPIVIGWLTKLFTKYREGVDKFNEVTAKVSSAFKTIGSWFDWLYNKASSVFNWFGRAGTGLSNSLRGAWGGLKDGFRAAINWIIGKWNGLQFTIGGGSFLGQNIPSASFGTPNIPYLASGGVANGLAVVGERGRELVRLPQGSTVIPHGQSEGMLAGMGGGAAHLILGFDSNSGSRLMDAIVEGMQNYVHSRGGNVQVALGRHGS